MDTAYNDFVLIQVQKSADKLWFMGVETSAPWKQGHTQEFQITFFIDLGK